MNKKSRTIERYWKYTSHPIKMRVFTYLSDSIAKWILCIYMLLVKSILSSTFIFVCSRHNQEIIMGTVQLCWPNIYSSSSPQKQNRTPPKRWRKTFEHLRVGFLQVKTALWSVFTRGHGGHIGVCKQWNDGHVGVQNQSCVSRTLFARKRFFFPINLHRYWPREWERYIRHWVDVQLDLTSAF